MRVAWGLVAAYVDFVGEFDVAYCGLDVFGEVDEDWSGSACCGDVERGVDGAGDFRDRAELDVVFGDWGGYADDVCLLERVSAYHVG